ncbi:MAG: ornithine carbamoyltransferase [Myxococcales bacterium]|nr:ornithine carbamoyltransferase [Myxococcales bacterium]
MKDLIETSDLSVDDLRLLLDLASRFKQRPYQHRSELSNQSVVLYFAKPSTRTRISMATAVARLGGVPITVSAAELQLGRGETIEDTARTISRYARAFVVRTFSDEDVRRFAAAASIPVVNALTDGHHPCQSLADLLTLQEKLGPVDRLRVAYVGDGNNVCHSLVQGVVMLGGSIAVATPPELVPDPAVIAGARVIGERTGGRVELFEDPAAATQGADAVYTDVWLSMGDADAERARRVALLERYRVDAALMARARPGAAFLHCLPDHRGEEVTTEVVDGPASVVFDQAENRLHTAVALLYALVEERLTGH